MLNYLWAFMILAGVLWGALCGNMAAITEGALSSAKEAVSLCITMLGVMSLWTGVLKIGERAGLIERLAKTLSPVLHFLFPQLPKDHPANRSIAANMIANILGLGWAATPAGLKAMEQLDEWEKEKNGETAQTDKTASREMCTFLIINISSLQLIPINMIAYRSQYKSASPTAILGPAIAATAASTLAAVIFCKIMDRA